MVEYATRVGGPALRRMTFHERALMLKAMAQHLMARKEEFYLVSAADRRDEPGFVGRHRGRHRHVLRLRVARAARVPERALLRRRPDGAASKGGTFVGRHICVPLEGVAVHINAFNFPVWGMLEKLAPTFLAGDARDREAGHRHVVSHRGDVSRDDRVGTLAGRRDSTDCGSTGDLLEHLDLQCAVAFTGSATTGKMLKTSPSILDHNVRFNMEADSLNYSMLGPDAAPGTPEFDLFIKEVVREMTTKAGQKCTAIRRTLRAGVDGAGRDGGARETTRGVTIGDPAWTACAWVRSPAAARW